MASLPIALLLRATNAKKDDFVVGWAGFLNVFIADCEHQQWQSTAADWLRGTVLLNRCVTVKLVLQVFTTPVKTSSTSATKQICFPPSPLPTAQFRGNL